VIAKLSGWQRELLLQFTANRQTLALVAPLGHSASRGTELAAKSLDAFMPCLALRLAGRNRPCAAADAAGRVQHESGV